ncbi:DinB family protein [Ferdinandcohnia sp. Marseille-Q9671]
MSYVINDSLFETRNELIQEIESLDNAQFNERPGEDKWSIAKVCHHLVLVELVTAKVIDLGLNETENSNRKRKDISLILDRTRKMKAPQIVEPSSERFEVQQIIKMLDHSRKKLLETIIEINDPTILKKKSMEHPAFGIIPLDQWIDLVYLHEQRHIMQIREMKLDITN